MSSAPEEPKVAPVYDGPDVQPALPTCSTSPQRLGPTRFADHHGLVLDFSKVKPVRHLLWSEKGSLNVYGDKEFCIFDFTPEVVAGWSAPEGRKHILGLSPDKFPFVTWRDRRLDTCFASLECPLARCEFIKDQKHGGEAWIDNSFGTRFRATMRSPEFRRPAKRFGFSVNRPNLIERPPVTVGTILLVGLHICGDLEGMVKVFRMNHQGISLDIRNAGLGSLFHQYFIWEVLTTLQQTTYLTAVPTSPTYILPISYLLISSVFDGAFADITPTGIVDKINMLFHRLPRLHQHNMRNYAIRCGLVYGSLAAYESKARDRRVRKYEIAAAAVTGATVTVANIPTLQGVPVGKILEPASTGLRGALNNVFDRRRKHLGSGLGQVEYRFLIDVMEEANQGLVASFPEGLPPVDADGNPRPAYSSERLFQFKKTAWQVFQVIMNAECCQIGFKLPDKLLQEFSHPPQPLSKRQEDVNYYPRISPDFQYFAEFDPPEKLAVTTYRISSSDQVGTVPQTLGTPSPAPNDSSAPPLSPSHLSPQQTTAAAHPATGEHNQRQVRAERTDYP